MSCHSWIHQSALSAVLTSSSFFPRACARESHARALAREWFCAVARLSVHAGTGLASNSGTTVKTVWEKKKLWTFIATWHATTSLHLNTNTLKAYFSHREPWQRLHWHFHLPCCALIFGGAYSLSIFYVFRINYDLNLHAWFKSQGKTNLRSLFFVEITTSKAAFWLVSGAISSTMRMTWQTGTRYFFPSFELKVWAHIFGKRGTWNLINVCKMISLRFTKNLIDGNQSIK